MAKIFEKGLNHYSNVCVGKNFTNDASYTIAYWEAGDILVDKAIAQYNHPKDRLFFPICYNYRHFIELSLKYLFMKAEELYFILETADMQNKKYEHNFSEKIDKTHNIHILLNWLTIILDCISDDKFSKEIVNYILEFHNMDKTGQKFRYPRSTNNEIHFDLREEFDLENIKKAMTTIGNYLMGIDMYLSEYGRFAKSYIAEMEAEMESIYGKEYEHQEDNYSDDYYYR